jgi:hypothetical protein
MMLLRLLSPQGIAGLAVSLALAILLVLQKAETRHWRKQSGQFGQLYRGEQAAFAGTGPRCRSRQCRTDRGRAARDQRKDVE